MRWLVLAAALLFVRAALSNEPLRSPWQSVPLPKPTSAPYECPHAPTLPRELQYDSYYSDSHYSIKNPAAEQVYRAAVAVPEDFARTVVRATDDYRGTGNLNAGHCATTLLAAAAGQQAFREPHLSARKSRQGFYVQTWLCTASSLAYLKLEGTPAESTAQHEAITKWLATLAESVRNFQNELRAHGSGDGRNNHHYWAALAVAAAGVASQRRDLFAWGIRAGRDGLQQITPEGTLPLEMDRRSMALHYHWFAAAPLVLLAELGEANGIDLYNERDGALRRLVLRTASGLADPRFFVGRTGVAQEPQNPASSGVISWAEPFARRFPDPTLSALLTKAPARGYWMFGGQPPP